MLYLARPQEPHLQWNDRPSSSMDIEGVARAHLDALTWHEADHVLDDDVVRLALRYGVACDLGIVIDAVRLFDLDQPAEMARMTEQEQAGLPADATQDSPAIAARRAVADHAERVHQRAIGDARLLRSQMLDVPLRPGLAEHWSGLGGALPDPR